MGASMNILPLLALLRRTKSLPCERRAASLHSALGETFNFTTTRGQNLQAETTAEKYTWT